MRTMFMKPRFSQVLIIVIMLSIIATTALASSPTATILSPADGMIEIRGASVFFEGTGDDPEDGALKGHSLIWTSDLEGLLGWGEYFGVKLATGTHVITLTVVDGDGEEAQAQVTVTIED